MFDPIGRVLQVNTWRNGMICVHVVSLFDPIGRVLQELDKQRYESKYEVSLFDPIGRVLQDSRL